MCIWYHLFNKYCVICESCLKTIALEMSITILAFTHGCHAGELLHATQSSTVATMVHTG